MKSFFLTLAILLGCALPALSQNVRVDGVVQSAHGPAPNVFVAVCSQPANLSVTPCTARVALCSSLTDVVCTSPNPVNSDGLGNYFFYIPAGGTYTYQFYGNGLQTRSFVDQQPGTATSTGAILLAPGGDQTIIGSHQLINRGTEQTGFPFTSFDAAIQAFALNPSTGQVAVSGQTSGSGNVGVQGIQTGGGSGSGVFGLGEGLNSATFGGFFTAFANVTAGNPYVGTGQFGQLNLTVTGSIAQDVGANAGEAKIYGGTVRSLSSYITAGNQDNAGGTGGVATNSYGYNVQQAMNIGTPGATINAAFHANDQGSGANNYGILLEGTTHNDLGGGVTKVGGLLASGLSANLPVCTDGSKNLSTSSCPPTSNVTYYVSNSGSDSNNGTSTGTPWQTLAKVASSTFNPGDIILLKRGNIWREFLIFPSAGSLGKPITIGAYDIGLAPRITAADVLTAGGFTVFSGANYQHALTTDPGSWVTENGVPLTKVGSTGAVTSTAGTFFWSANVVYIHATDGSNPSSSGKVYESGIRFAALTAKSYNTVDGLQLDFGTFVVNADQANGATFRNTSLKFGNSNDVWVSDSPKTDNQTFDNDEFAYSPTGLYCHGDNFYVRNSNLHNLTRSIELRDITSQHCKNFQITGNVFSNDGGAGEVNAGVLLDGDTNSSNTDYHQGTIQNNQFNNMQSRPIDGFFGDSFILGNTISYTSAGGAGSDVAIEINGPGNTACGNTIRNTSNIGLMVNVDPIAADRATTLCDNVIIQTAGALNHVIYIVAGAPQPVFSNNQYWPGNVGAVKYFWHGTDYNFTNWVIQSGDSTSSEYPQATQAQVQYCGTTTACAKTLQSSPITVFGDVTFPGATTVSLSGLPFTSSTSYSCTASDLTTAAGVVNFTTYTSGAAATLTETGGTNADHARYICVGN